MTIFLKEAAELIPGAILVGNEAVDFRDIEYDSRRIESGSVFIAITGFQQNGNNFIDDAVGRGAVAVVTEQEGDRRVPQLIVSDARAALADIAAELYQHPDAHLKIYGVTGTNGKTTTCYLIRKILRARSAQVGLVTSLVYDNGVKQSAASRTTPESLDLFRLLRDMNKNKCTHAVIEISSHALSLERVRNLNLTVAVYTNFTRDHLDFHKDMNDYLMAKARLLGMVGKRGGSAVINYDCREFREMIEDSSLPRMTYSLQDPGADIYLKSFRLGREDTEFEMYTPEGTRRIIWGLPGRFNLYNALAAATATIASGIGLDAVVKGLQSATTVPGRLERLQTKAPFSIFIDFAHTPDALKRTIETVREMADGKILTLFGCGGDRDKGKRPMMGKTASALSDYCVLTADNSRSEKTTDIFNDVKKGLQPGSEVEIIENRAEAIGAIFARAETGDIVLLTGKGDERFQDVDGTRQPWSEREIAFEQLRKLEIEN